MPTCDGPLKNVQLLRSPCPSALDVRKSTPHVSGLRAPCIRAFLNGPGDKPGRSLDAAIPSSFSSGATDFKSVHLPFSFSSVPGRIPFPCAFSASAQGAATGACRRRGNVSGRAVEKHPSAAFPSSFAIRRTEKGTTHGSGFRGPCIRAFLNSPSHAYGRDVSIAPLGTPGRAPANIGRGVGASRSANSGFFGAPCRRSAAPAKSSV